MNKLFAICYGIVCLLLYPVAAFGEEGGVKDSPTPVSPLYNIGFMQPKPKHLAKKFPMCDAFLKVDWIDKKKKVGYSKHEIILDKTGERKTRWVLIWLDPVEHKIFDVYQYKISGKLEGLFASIRSGKISSDNWGGSVLIKDGKKSERILTYSGGTTFTISGHKQMVCVLYPNEKRSWIYETKTVHTLSGQVKNELSLRNDAINKVRMNNKFFQSCSVIDINHDGMVDFRCWPAWMTYSQHGQYYENMQISISVTRSTWRFPPSTTEYTIFPERIGYYLTTDGKDYFLSDLNISAATTLPQKEN